jgi:crotonobetainyl-CoA:carnitine CoA-transferase CaiB-like acyl-CoA transferase
VAQVLNDLRVVDFSAVTAGAGSTVVLADLGADVIKIESWDHPDSFRGGLGFTTGNPGDVVSTQERAPLRGPFTTVNRNKRAICIDMKTGHGVEIVRRLVAISDVVVENFRRGVIERWGLGFDELVKLRKDIVLVSISSQGATGPNSVYGSFGSVLDALGGTASVTGYDVDTPRWSSNRVNYPDQLVSMYAPGLILAAVMRARARGEGCWIDLSQRELTTAVVGELLLERSITGIDPIPMGNQGLTGFEWVSPSSGDDEWLAISVQTYGQLDALCRVLDENNPISESAFRSVEAHLKNLQEMQQLLTPWSSRHDKNSAARILQGIGIAAAPVNKSYELLDDPYLRSIDFYHEVELPNRSELERGFLVRFEEPKDAASIQRRAPYIGEHTTEVLTQLLDYSEAEVEAFKAEGVVAGI